MRKIESFQLIIINWFKSVPNNYSNGEYKSKVTDRNTVALVSVLES